MSLKFNVKSKIKIVLIFIYLLGSLIFLLFGSFYITQYYGIPFNDPIFILVNIIGSLFIVVVVEFAIIYGFLRSPDLIKKDLFLSVLIVNLAIFLPIQTVAYLLLAWYIIIYPFYTLAITFLFFYLEWLFYCFQFQRLLKRRSINKELSRKKIALISFLANLPMALLINIYSPIMLLLNFISFPELYF
ncbi:MAG: hypothetical protein ACFFA4_14020 [Promethearchaeota archaeon]